MPTEYLWKDRQFITDFTEENLSRIKSFRLFPRAMLEDIAGKLKNAGYAKLDDNGNYATKFQFYSSGRAQLHDDNNVIFDVFLLEDGTWEVQITKENRYNQRQLAQSSAA